MDGEDDRGDNGCVDSRDDMGDSGGDASRASSTEDRPDREGTAVPTSNGSE